MLPPFDYLEHRRACEAKQSERSRRIISLPFAYHGPITSSDRRILAAPIRELVQNVHQQPAFAGDILHTYGKIAVLAHAKTNCLTEVMLIEAEKWAKGEGVNLKGPLAGLPVSLKDSIAVGGFDVSVGYSCNTGSPYQEDGSLVKILKEAGAIPYVKTNVPTTLLSFESSNDVWGRCLNPHNTNYSPGGSSGGEAALLAYGGSRIGVGSDVAGSVRVPAHFSGCYSLRCSTGRWPKMGMNTSTPGQEGVPSVFSPMARTLEDLVYFTRCVIEARPWQRDHTVHPVEWNRALEDETRSKEIYRVGVMRTDGVVDPAPACYRALEQTASALANRGHTIVEVTPPSPYLALQIGSNLLTADGCKTFLQFFRTGETNDPGARQMSLYMKLPRSFKYLYYLWVRYITRDHMWAGLLEHWHEKSSYEQWRWVAKREAYKALWHEWWSEQDIDFMLTPVNATPAVPHFGMREAVSSCGYTFLFNLLDYTCGVMPITHVDRILDKLPKTFHPRKLNGIARGAYSHYDADKMHGLPVAVQVVSQRLQEEKVLEIMERVEGALAESGGKYTLLEID